MIKVLWACATVSLLAAAIAPDAVAQELRIGRDTRGELRRGDAVHEYGAFEDTYTLQGQAGQTLVITSESRTLSTRLNVVGPRGFSAEGRTADNRAAVYLALSETGEYQIKVRGPYGDARGRYTLHAEPVDPTALAATATATALSLSTPISGTLQASDPRYSTGVNGDAYEFTGRARQQIEIRMRSPDFNTLLSITGPNGFRATNSYDMLWGRPNRNARLAVTLPADGAYRIVATTSESEAKAGSYVVEVVSEDQAVRDRAELIASAQSVLVRAYNYANAGDNNNAIANYEYALRLRPNDIGALNNIGVMYIRSNDPVTAAAYLNRALQIAPTDAQAQHNLQIANQRIAQNQAAQQRQQEEQARQQAVQEAARRQREAEEAQAWSRLLTGAVVAAAGGDANQIGQALNGQTVTPRQQPQQPQPRQQSASSSSDRQNNFSWANESSCLSFRHLSSSVAGARYEVSSACATDVFFSFGPVFAPNDWSRRDAGEGGTLRAGETIVVNIADARYRQESMTVRFACKTNRWASMAIGVEVRSVNFDWERGVCTAERVPDSQPTAN